MAQGTLSFLAGVTSFRTEGDFSIVTGSMIFMTDPPKCRVLTGVQLKGIRSLRKALKILHVERQVPHVVISSIPLAKLFESELQAASLLPLGIGPVTPSSLVPVETDDVAFTSEKLLCLTSSVLSAPRSSSNSKQPVSIPFTSEIHVAMLPKIKGYFSGVGDLFSALILGHFTPALSGVGDEDTAGNQALCTATSNALSITQAILIRTNAHSSSLPAEDCPPSDDEKDTQDPDRHVKRMKARELRIIQGVEDILRPNGAVELHAWDSFWELEAETPMGD